MMESVVAYDDTRDDEEERRRMTVTHAVSTSGRHRKGMDFNDDASRNMITKTASGGSSWIRRRRTTKGRGGEKGNDDEDDEDDEDDDDGEDGDGGSKSIARRGRESPTSPLPRTRDFERGLLHPSKGILSPISSIGRRQTTTTTTTTTTTPLASSSTSTPSSKSVRFETELPNGFPERKPSGRRTPRRASDFAGFGLALDDYPIDDASPWSSLLAVFAVVAFVSWMSTVIHGLFDLFAVAP